MTVASNTPYVQYSATTAQTVFNYTFEIVQQEDILVYQRGEIDAPDDVADLLVLNVDYTVAGVGNENGGTITLTVAATLNDVVTLKQNLTVERDTSFTNGGVLRAQDLNDEFDNQTLIQQVTRFNEDSRMLYYPDSAVLTPFVDNILPVLEANQIWAKNNADTAIVAYDVPSGGGLAPSTATYLLQTADAGLPNAQAMGALASGLVVNTTTTGVQLTRTLTGTANQIDIANGNGISGNPTASISDNPVLSGTAGMGIPSGTTAQRVTPTGTSIGLRFNTDINALEAYISSAWVAIPSAVAGIFLELAGGTMAGTIDMDSNIITGLPLPSAASEAATKGYVDGLVLNLIQACNYATTANLAGYTYANGTAGVGAALTAGANGAFSTDGASPALNDRIFVSFQTAQEENGIYTLSTVGDGSNPAVLTRATDWDVSADMQAGDTVVVVAGTLYAGSHWMMTQTAAITVGTTAITWIDISVPNDIVTITGSQTVTGQKTFVAPVLGVATGTSLNLGSTTTITGMIDDDTFAMASSSLAASSESIAAYINTELTGALTPESIDFTTTAEIIGTTTNDNADAGSVGEYKESVILAASAISILAVTATNLTSISLEAGDWDVWGNTFIVGGTITSNIAWVSSTSATIPDGAFAAQVPSNGTRGTPTLTRRFSLSSTTTIYVSAFITLSSGSAVMSGGIFARRRR